MVLDFAAQDLDDTHQVIVTAPYLELSVVAPGVAGPRRSSCRRRVGRDRAHRDDDGGIELEVASLQTSAPATARVTTVRLEITDLAASAVLVGGTTGARTSPTPIARLWRYDMKAGTRTPAHQPPRCLHRLSPRGVLRRSADAR